MIERLWNDVLDMTWKKVNRDLSNKNIFLIEASFRVAGL
jgi:hypothetical protein